MDAVQLSGKRVAVTGANGRVGRSLLPHLKAAGAQTTALVRRPVTVEGADDIIAEWMTAPAALDALRRSDIIIHLTGDLFLRSREAYYAANVATTQRVIAGVRDGQAKRLISLGYIGADAASPNMYLQTNGLREKLLRESGVPAIIFRCPAIVNTPDDPNSTERALTAKEGKSVQMLGNGQQRWQAVFHGDVVAAVLAACERGKAGVYDLVGPEAMTADDLIRIVNRDPHVKIAHTPALLARIASRFMADLPPTYVDIALRDAVGDPQIVAREFGLTLTSLRNVWRVA